MKLYLKILLSLSLFLSSCAPILSERDFSPVLKTLKPRLEDSDLHLRLRELGEAPPELAWQGEISTAEYFSQIENLIRLGDTSGRSGLRHKGISWLQEFYNTPGLATPGELALSPYLGMATGYVEQQVQSSLNDVLLQMEEARHVILRHVLALGTKQPAPPSKGLEGMLALAEDFTRRVLADIPNMNLPPVIEEGFRTELINTTRPLFNDAKLLLDSYKKVTRLSQALALIENAIQKFQVELDPELLKSLKQGRRIATGLDAMNDAQGALSVLVDVWRILTPLERREKIKPANEDLYDFLVKQSPKELECLKTRGCLGGPVDGLIKKAFILPKIRKYGVSNLRKEMNQQTLEYVAATLETTAQEFVLTMPQTFAENIEISWLAKVDRMVAVRTDLQSYVNRVGGVWAKRLLPASEGKIPGFEVARVHVKASPQEPLRLTPSAPALELDGEVAGASLSANILLLENTPFENPLSLPAAFSQINKIVAMAGYRDTRDQLVPALFAPVGRDPRLLDIAHFEAVKDKNHSFRLPDRIRLRDAFRATTANDYARSFSAAGLARQIQGLSASLRFTADWKTSSFDKLLGPITAQDLTTDARGEELQQPLFPKDMLFALNVGTLSVLLQELIKKTTPVFLITLEGRRLWADEYSAENPETPIMAGIVDIKDGERVAVAKAPDAALFLLALAEFIQTTEGVDATRSPLLLKKNPQGLRPLDSLDTGRQDLRRLSIALANFLSAKMKTSSALIQESLHFETLDTSSARATLRVETQALTIRALLKAYELTGIEAYQWTAEEIYYAMNRELYRVKDEFYVNGDGSEPSFGEKLETLRALSELKPHLPAQSREQLERIMNPWLDALAALR